MSIETSGEAKVMEIRYTGKITKADFLKCILISSPQLKYQKWFFGFILFFVICPLSVLANGKNPAMSSDTLKYMLPSALFFLCIFTFPWWLPYIQLSSYDQKGNIYRNDVHGTITDTEISISGEEIKASFQWSIYTDYKLDKDIFLLFQGKRGFSAFKSAMFNSQDEWEKFIRLAKEKVLVNKNRA